VDEGFKPAPRVVLPPAEMGVRFLLPVAVCLLLGAATVVGWMLLR